MKNDMTKKEMKALIGKIHTNHYGKKLVISEFERMEKGLVVYFSNSPEWVMATELNLA